MLESLKSITEIPDLRKRILFTLAMLAVYRLGAFIPTPGINADVFEQMFSQMGGSLFGLLAMFSGGSLRRLTVFALGIMPYITASIILQLLTVVSPHLEKLKKEGDLGRKKITDYTRWMTVGLSAFQAFGIAIALEKQTALGVADGQSSGSGVRLYHRIDADHRGPFYYVAGRTDHLTRHRQRDVAVDFRRHRGGTASGRGRPL